MIIEILILFVNSSFVDESSMFFGSAPFTSQARVNFDMPPSSSPVAYQRIFDSQERGDANAMAGPSVGESFLGARFERKKMPRNWGRMVARPPPDAMEKRMERRQEFEKYVEENRYGLDNERLMELHGELERMKDKRAVLDGKIQVLEEYMARIWEDLDQRIDSD